MLVLGIETSCDETAASVVEDGRWVRSDVVSSQIKVHAAYGGVVPEVASRQHVATIIPVLRRATSEAGIALADLDGIAVTAGPGLVGGVMVGLSAGKAIAMARGIPLVAVNHLEGHALSPRLAEDLPYPYLLLLVSGGHCQLLAVEGVGACERLGSTIDDAAGEAFDKIGKSLGLPYPGGPALEKLAEGGEAARFPLPRALLGRKDCDFSFSGLKTAAARLAGGAQTEHDRRDIAAAAQGAIAGQLADRTARAMGLYARSHAGSPLRFAVAGGVAANGEVRRRLQATAREHGFTFAAPPLAYCTDNAAMIALAGGERLRAGFTSGLDAAARPRWPLDEAAAAERPTHAPGRKGAKA